MRTQHRYYLATDQTGRPVTRCRLTQREVKNDLALLGEVDPGNDPGKSPGNCPGDIARDADLTRKTPGKNPWWSSRKTPGNYPGTQAEKSLVNSPEKDLVILALIPANRSWSYRATSLIGIGLAWGLIAAMIAFLAAGTTFLLVSIFGF